MLEWFEDVRGVQKGPIREGIQIVEGSKGPENIIIIDPDGNPILIDQCM